MTPELNYGLFGDKTPSSLAVVNDYFSGEFGVLSVWPRGFRLGSFLNPKPKTLTLTLKGFWAQRPNYIRLFGYFDAKGNGEYRARDVLGTSGCGVEGLGLKGVLLDSSRGPGSPP